VFFFGQLPEPPDILFKLAENEKAALFHPFRMFSIENYDYLVWCFHVVLVVGFEVIVIVDATQQGLRNAVLEAEAR